jgi:hypothetical protein
MAITLDGTNGVTTPDLTVDSTTITVDPSNNRVGIGTGSPTTALTLGTSHTATVQNGGSVSAPAYGIVSGAIGVNGTYVPAANTLGFVVGGAERGRFTANGLTFNGDTAAANALDDYEEGTFTPNVYHAGSNNSTFSTKTGEYTKIGNTVTCQIRIDHGNSGTAGSDLTLSGLPFTPAQAHSTMSIGIWGANPQAVGNIFGGSLPTMFKGGQNIQTQISFFTAMLVYKTS